MSTKLSSALARIPLWKRKIPRYPLYYKGDQQRRVFLPLFWMKMIPPEEKVPANYVNFIVHPQMNRNDIKQYLEKIYDVSVLNVRTELRTKDIQANSFKSGYILPQKETVWREEEKYAYVQLADNCKFKYPDFFKNGGLTKAMSALKEQDEKSRTFKKHLSKKSPFVGLPAWFVGKK